MKIPPRVIMLRLVIAVAGLVSQANAAMTGSAAKMTMSARAGLRYQQEMARMRREHKQAMETFTRTTSLDKAYKVLKHHPKATAVILSLVEKTLRGQTLRGRTHLESTYSPSGGVVKARDMLNSMLTNVTMKLDSQHQECSMFFQTQCSMMEKTREDISESNSEAADYRGQVLLAQKEINVCEINIPRIETELEEAMAECEKRRGFLRRDLKVVLEDIEVMDSVLALTECQGDFLQTSKVSLLKCRDDCPSFIDVDHPEIQVHLSKLQSPAVKKRVQDGLRELMEEHAEPEDALLQTGAEPQVTVWSNDPLPQARIPADPCRGISYDNGKKTGGCSLRTNPNCKNLQNKFVTIQSDTVDKKDELLDTLDKHNKACALTKQTLEAEIQSFEIKLGSENSKLAESTAGENSAAEEAKMKSEQHEQEESTLMTTRKSCSENLRQFESEICSLKKIRGELFKLKGDTHPFFQDCEVGEWEARECSKSCDGGVQTLERAVVASPAGGGMACPPLEMKQSCNEQPCPVDCKLSEWSGFSACSADCGGGVMEKTRMVLVHPKYEGTPCGDLTETVSCNMQSCDKDCELGEWSEWSTCTKACGLGFKRKRKEVVAAAVGRGKCPSTRSWLRLRYEKCNAHKCVESLVKPMVCKSAVDIVLVLDSSGSTGSSGWEKTKTFAKAFTTSLEGDGTDAMLSIVSFSGPGSWKKISTCTGPDPSGLDMAQDCFVLMAEHFTKDMAKSRSVIDGLDWMAGLTLTSTALEMAASELGLGRRGVPKVVLMVTDGRPTKRLATFPAAHKVRKQARLIFGAVGLDSSTLTDMRSWASSPSKENVFNIRDYGSLDTVKMVDEFVADICSEVGN